MMRTGIIPAAAILLSLLAAPQARGQEVPPNDGFVTDAAGIFSAEQEQSLERNLQQYRDATSNEIAVVTVPALSGAVIADLAVEIGRKWGVGTEENDNGILLLVAYADREVFIATGYGLEGAVPDIVAKGIIDQDIVPAFREGEYYQGVAAAVDAIKKHIGGEYTADRYESGGAFAWSGWMFFLLFIGLDWLAALFGRSRSWWLGGVVGGALGMVLTWLYAWWLAIPALAGLGLFFDYLLSKRGYGKNRRGRGPRGPGGFFGGGRGGGGGFGGFGGGSFGGGGAGGKW